MCSTTQPKPSPNPRPRPSATLSPIPNLSPSHNPNRHPKPNPIPEPEPGPDQVPDHAPRRRAGAVLHRCAPGGRRRARRAAHRAHTPRLAVGAAQRGELPGQRVGRDGAAGDAWRPAAGDPPGLPRAAQGDEQGEDQAGGVTACL